MLPWLLLLLYKNQDCFKFILRLKSNLCHLYAILFQSAVKLQFISSFGLVEPERNYSNIADQRAIEKEKLFDDCITRQAMIIYSPVDACTHARTLDRAPLLASRQYFPPAFRQKRRGAFPANHTDRPCYFHPSASHACKVRRLSCVFERPSFSLSE